MIRLCPSLKLNSDWKSPEVWVYVWWESQFMVESRSHEFIFLSVDRLFETLLQVMSNDGLKLLYVQLHRHLSTQFNNTGGEANLKKCMLLCLIQTSVLLLSSKRVKVTILKDSVLIDIWKEVDVEDYGSIITEQVAELYDFRKRLKYQYSSTRHSVLYHHTRFFGSHISNFRLWQKRTSEVNRKSSASTKSFQKM